MDKITVREWILIIGLLLLIEFVISSNSYTFRDDQTLLNYISFASTIASILLAVIAIIYGFLQSDSSSKANNRLLDSLDEFKKIHGKILKNSERSDKQLDRLTLITNMLQDLNGSMIQSSTKISSMENKLVELHESNKIVKDELIRMSNLKNETTPDIDTEDISNNESIARAMLRRTTIHADLIAYALNKMNVDNDKITISEFGAKYLYPLRDKVDEKDKSLFDIKILMATSFTVLNMLKAVNLISIDEDSKHIIISHELSSELPIFAEEIDLYNLKPIKLALNAISSL